MVFSYTKLHYTKYTKKGCEVMSILEFDKNILPFLDDDLEFGEIIDRLLEEDYEDLQMFLRKRNLSYEQALEKVGSFRNEFLHQCRINQISVEQKKSAVTYFQNHEINENNQWIFAAILCDNGYLLDMERKYRSKEQDISSGIRCMEEMQKVLQYFDFCRRHHQQFEQLISILPNHLQPVYTENKREVADIIQILDQWWFCGEDGYVIDVLKNNLIEILAMAQANSSLLSIKPLFLFLLLRNHKSRIAETEGIRYQIQKLFQHKKYKIDEDNGRNFKSHADMICLFEALCRYYEQDTDINLDLCRYGFSATSNIAQWYYEQYFVEQDSFILPGAFNIVRQSEFRFNDELADISDWTMFDTPYYKRISKFLETYFRDHSQEIQKSVSRNNGVLAQKIYKTIILPEGLCAPVDEKKVIELIKHELYSISEELTYEVFERCLYQWIGI